MPATHRLRVKLNAGAWQTGGVTAALGDTVALSPDNTVGVTSYRYEIFDYPPGFACPAGWSTDANSVYYSTAATPPDFALDAVEWGKYALRLTVNGGVSEVIVGKTTRVQADPLLIDEATALSVPSAIGLVGLMQRETNQFGGVDWTRQINNDARAMAAAAGGAVAMREPVRLAATANIADLSNAGANMDGEALQVADRVLLPLQTTQTQNGIYAVASLTPTVLTRASDFAAGASVNAGLTIAVQAGAAWQGSTWTLRGDGALTVDTDALPFVSDVDEINVRNFGTVANGTTDDHDAIMSAHAALPATGGTLRFPDGVYASTDLVFTKPVHVRLGRGGLTALGTKLITATTNFRITGQSQGQTTITLGAGDTGIYLGPGWTYTLEGDAVFEAARLTFNGGARHIDAKDLTGLNEGDFAVHDCTLYRATTTAVDLHDSVYYGHVEKNNFTECNRGLKIASYTETKVRHNVFRQSPTGAESLWLRGSHHADVYMNQFYGYPPNVNPDILFEPTNDGATGYCEIHRNKFGAEREYWHRKRPRIVHRRRALMTGAPTLTFAEVGGTGDTITRDSGSWIDDGFTTNTTVTVTGSVSNNISGAGVTLVTASTLTLGSTDLVDEVKAGCTVIGDGEQHFNSNVVRIRANEFLAARGLALSSIGRASNVVTATVTVPGYSDHGFEVGDDILLIACSGTDDFCGRHTVTAKTELTVSWAQTAGDVGQSNRGGVIASAELTAIVLDSPMTDAGYSENHFDGYAYGVEEAYEEKATVADLSGRCTWDGTNRLVGPLSLETQEFKHGGRGFSLFQPQVTSPLKGFGYAEQRPREAPGGLLNRFPYSEAVDQWGELGMTVTTGQTDPWGTTRACLIERDGADQIVTTAGGGGYSLTEGCARSFDQTDLPEVCFLKFWAKAGATRTLWVSFGDGGGLQPFQHTFTLGDDWKQYCVPVAWNITPGTLQMQIAPGGVYQQPGGCYVCAFQLDDVGGDYLLTPGATGGSSEAGQHFERAISVGSDPTVGATFGAGSPEGAVTAGIGSIYLRTDGGAGTSFYVKESGTGNTGWVGK